jgi:hypothetical protein
VVTAQDITAALGGKWQGSFGLCRCPVHADSTPSLKVRDDPRKGDGVDCHCFAGCRWQDIKAELGARGLLPAFDPRRMTPLSLFTPKGVDAENDAVGGANKIELARKIWRAAVPLSGSPGERYLIEQRKLTGVEQLDLAHVLRWHEGFAAIVMMMTDARTGESVGVHRTFLTDDGRKRERKMLGRQGVIRLSPDEDVCEGLGICEGIEDGLAVLLSGWAPVWAATNAGGVERFPVLPGIEALTIFHDEDDAGTRAAESCAQRWASAGREVFL